MGKVVKFSSRRKPKREVSTLCKNGHHRWVIDKAKQFDVKQGRLVTVYRCSRCGASKSTAH